MYGTVIRLLTGIGADGVGHDDGGDIFLAVATGNHLSAESRGAIDPRCWMSAILDTSRFGRMG